MFIIAAVVSTICYFFLYETLADVVLKNKKVKLEKEHYIYGKIYIRIESSRV